MKPTVAGVRRGPVERRPSPPAPIAPDEVIAALLEAGLAGARELLALRSGAAVHVKRDGSPCSEADLKSDATIRRALAVGLPGIGVVSEEHPDGWHDGGDAEDRFILVDPLDGTREYLAGLSEFTINLALVEKGRPTAACIVAPASGEAWTALASRTGLTTWVFGPACNDPRGTALATPAEAHQRRAGPLRLVLSRSHGCAADRSFGPITRDATIVPSGSALKFVKVATGIADAYPRRQPTMQWDTAAGDLLVASMGGAVLTADGQPIRYGARGGFTNGPFIAAASEALARDLLAYWPT